MTPRTMSLSLRPSLRALAALLVCSAWPVWPSSLAVGQDTAGPGVQPAVGPLRLELEALGGKTRRLAGDAPALRSLAAEGAAFARYVGQAPVVPATLDARAVAEVELVGGDRLRGVLRPAGADQLAVELGGVSLTVDLDAIRSWVYPARLPADLAAAPVGSSEADVLYFVAGRGLDRAEGLVDGFTDEGLRFEDSRVGARSYGWERLAAVFVAALDEEGGDAAAAPPAGERVRVQLRDGGRVTGRLVSLDLAGVALEDTVGGALTLPSELVAEVTLADGSFVFLTELAVADGGPTSPFGDELGFTWPHRIDRAVDGGPLRVAGRVELRGIGVHAPSRLTWRLDGAFETLRLAAAVDDSGAGTERAGAVRFIVRAEGRELWRSEVVRAGQGAVTPPPIDVRGVRELVLEVDAEGDFVLDRANWLRPVLVRAAR